MNLEEWNYYDEPDKPFKRISREEFEKWLQEVKHRAEESSPNSYVWQVDTADGQHIGWINYYNWNQPTKRVFIGICLPDEEVWSKGYCTEAVKILVDHLFGETGLEEVTIATWTGYKRMIRCAEKCGFQEIARMPHRTEYSIRGELLERIEFSISRTEWLDIVDGG